MAERRIVFLVQTPFSQRDYVRNGIAYLAEQGIAVTVLDVSRLAMPRLTSVPECFEFPGMALRIVDTPAKLAAESTTLAQAGVIVCHVGSGYVMPNSLGVLRAVARSGRPSLLTSINSQPYWRRKSGLADLKPGKLLDRLRTGGLTAALLNRLPMGLLGVKPFDYVVYGGRGSRAARRLVTGQTRVIAAHSMDYDVYLAERDTPRSEPERPYAVFIDQFIGYHPDDAMGMPQPENPKVFYVLLRRLFDRVEAELGLSVVIAAHPRADYSNKGDLFGGRQMVIGNTAALVHQSRLVLTSFSIAIGYAVLFDKPTAMIATETMLRHPMVGDSIRLLNGELEVPLLRVDEEYRLDEVMTHPRSRFTAYAEDWIRAAGSPEQPLWQVIVRALERDGVL